MEKQMPVNEPSNNIFSEFGIKINELEEKQRLLKDRLLLVGNNLISTKEDYDKEFLDLKKQVKDMEYDIKMLKQTSERIINELNNLAKKSEVDILKRQMKMFEPMGYARITDVKDIFAEEFKKIKREKINIDK